MTWQDEALCATENPTWWFPEERGQSIAQAKARRICMTCPVQAQCLNAALANDERYGIWGGVNMNGTRAGIRDELRRQRGVRALDNFEHGTEAGAKNHYRRGQSACGPCKAAKLARRRRESRT